MPTVRYTADGGHYRVGGHGFDTGDEADVDDDLADYLADRDDFEVVDQMESAELSEDEIVDTLDAADDESGTLPFNPESHTNDEIAEKVADINDEAALVALRNLEAEQEDRAGATDAIEDRLAELED